MFFINIDVIKKLETSANNFEDIRKELSPPHNVGVYVLKNGKDVLYVGMSTSIVSRINNHLSGNGVSVGNNDKISDIDIYITENNSYADMLETWLIMKLNPKLNKAKTTIIPDEPKDIDELLMCYDEQILELTERITEIRHEIINDNKSGYYPGSYALSDIEMLSDERDELKAKVKRLKNRGAESLENFSQFAATENNAMRRITYRYLEEGVK